MVFIRSRKGLDLDLGLTKPESCEKIEAGPCMGTDLSPFASLPLKVLVREGERVRIGTPLVQERGPSKRKIVSVCSGKVKEIRRGLKRQPLCVIVEKDEDEKEDKEERLKPLKEASKEQVLERMGSLGLFAKISQRPFDIPADPTFLPQAIFIKALDKAPGALGYETMVEKNAARFRAGLRALQTIAPSAVHLTCDESSTCVHFKNNPDANCHTVEGPYPACSPSLHISRIAPIQSVENIIWTLDALAVISLGKAVEEGGVFTDREIAVYDGKSSRRLSCKAGVLIGDLVSSKEAARLICGSPLTGVERTSNDPLPDFSQVLFIIPEDHTRQMLHFMRLKSSDYTATRTFFHTKRPRFSTNQHGEERPFVDGSIYDRLTPLSIPTMPLVKAVIAQDFERAKELGLLEIAGEDFALATFICPSKIEMMDIISSGLKLYANQLL